ncbi:MAG: hypothetical protein RMK30_09155 [Anaerolineae bacterium]|nr:hypothetical protein [Anaerolineae bacterium]MDW8103030.1 hypothetical protein [Anaerolineae bacterium]
MKWVLEVGGISLAIEGPACWVEPFKQAWKRWTGNSSSWTVSLEADEGLLIPEAPLFTVLPSFTDNGCFLKAVGFAGEIISHERRARLRAHPQAFLGDIAYFLRVTFALSAFESGGILFHAAGVIHRGQALAFFGPSGSGKTTLVRLSEGKEVLSDDLLLLRCSSQGWEAWATPFSLHRGNKLSSPLCALIRLVKAEEDQLVPLSSGVALGEAVASSPVINADPSRLPELFARWEEILSSVPAFALYFRKSVAFWEVIDVEFGGNTEPRSWNPLSSS